MFKKILLIVGLSAVIFVSCSPKHSEIIVAEYGEYDIKLPEFENAYSKNIGDIEKAKNDSLKNYNKFLDLYVNYKMKLRNAEMRKLDEDPSIKAELMEYEKTIGSSYLIEKELYEKGLQDLYEKRKTELRVSHLLIRTDNLSQEEAEKKAFAILDSIKNGESFENAVRKNSDDQFSKNKGGDIYYITAGNVIPDFEDIAYSTPVGTVNETPLKTKYGFHIIKVTEIKDRIPLIRASHILIKKEDEKGTVDSKEQYKLAQDILNRTKNGEDFAKLAEEFSQDPGSKAKGGDLGYFARRQMVQQFDEAVFKLKVGEISEIVETQFGYHIIKLTDANEYPSFEKEKQSLREIYEKTRKTRDYEKLVDKYSKDLNLIMNDEAIKEVLSNANEFKVGPQYWNSDYHKNFGSKELFKIGEEKFPLHSMFSFAINDPKLVGKELNESNFNSILNDFKSNKVLEAEASKLAKGDGEFARLMNEYKSGILIFKLQEEEVWNKMKMDSVAIHNLYLQTKESYIWPDRVEYSEIFVISDSVANACVEMLKNGADFDSLLVKYNQKPKTNNDSNELVDANKNGLSKAAYEIEKDGEFTGPIRNVNGWSIIKLIKKEPSRIKTYDEARPEVTSAYQDIESAQLENDYVAKLKKTYEPKYFYEELKNAYKN
jgi:peptidyl-prolyl cis-trans isomerase SurA